MAITGVGNYSSVYENTYASSRKEAAKKEETAATEKNAEVAKSGGNEEYLNNLQKQFPNMKLQVGYGVNTKNDGKVDVLNINPKLLEKMQNDPKAAKEYTQRLKDVEAAHKYVDSFFAATGSTVVCRHAYLDENGNYSNFTVSVRKDVLNEKLRKEAQENAEERIEKSREKARENAEQLAEKLEEKAEEAKGSEKSEEKKVVTEDGTTTPNPVHQPLHAFRDLPPALIHFSQSLLSLIRHQIIFPRYLLILRLKPPAPPQFLFLQTVEDRVECSFF